MAKVDTGEHSQDVRTLTGHTQHLAPHSMPGISHRLRHILSDIDGYQHQLGMCRSRDVDGEADILAIIGNLRERDVNPGTVFARKLPVTGSNDVAAPGPGNRIGRSATGKRISKDFVHGHLIGQVPAFLNASSGILN